MASLLLKGRLALELPKINQALAHACKELPLSVQPVAEHIFAAGGKRLRPFLTLLTARLLGYTQEDIYTLAISLEMLHAATLLHDDIIDQAPLRRGQPAAHTCFPLNTTILAGDALLAAGNALVATFNDPQLSLCFSKATTMTCAGEITEIAHQHDPDLSEASYLEIIRGKTAFLISCACTMGAIVAKAPEEQVKACTSFGENIGLAFQLVDDALDFAPESVTGKPSGGDLREGKLTPPLRYYQQSLSTQARQEFDAAFRTGTFSPQECQDIAHAIHAQGFMQTTRDCANTYLSQALEALLPLPQRPEKDLLKAMAEYVRDRTK
ncbi:MAG: polyprenyl synthetase family protein [Desulfovibrionaceae bacterium]|nr:polyprenyl synthetase family protein [Desulfovibrionaceae bacterium]